MRYLGGKKRQSKQIVERIRRLYPDFTTYVEPFCGALWSACAVMDAFPGRRYILNDANPYLMCTWREGQKGWDPPEKITLEQHRDYKKRRPVNDPLTGYIGFAWSFGGDFFHALARGKAGDDSSAKGSVASTVRKVVSLRHHLPTLLCNDFFNIKIPKGSMVYLDPPYERRAKAGGKQAFCRDTYYTWAEDLSEKCVVIATEFVNPRGWELLHDFGDTVVRHHSSKGKDGTRELLMRVHKRGGARWEPPRGEVDLFS